VPVNDTMSNDLLYRNGSRKKCVFVVERHSVRKTIIRSNAVRKLKLKQYKRGGKSPSDIASICLALTRNLQVKVIIERELILCENSSIIFFFNFIVTIQQINVYEAIKYEHLHVNHAPLITNLHQSELLGQFRLISDRASDVSGGRICLTQNAYAEL